MLKPWHVGNSGVARNGGCSFGTLLQATRKIERVSTCEHVTSFRVASFLFVWTCTACTACTVIWIHLALFDQRWACENCPGLRARDDSAEEGSSECPFDCAQSVLDCLIAVLQNIVRFRSLKIIKNHKLNVIIKRYRCGWCLEGLLDVRSSLAPAPPTLVANRSTLRGPRVLCTA